jgi:hypothetical protein
VEAMSDRGVELRELVCASMELCPDEVARTQLVSELVRECYGWVKANMPGGGLDGMDSSERTPLV